MDGKVAVVTGSTSGIGLGIARALADKGCSVILTGLADQSLIDSLVTEFRSKYKGKTEFVACDLSIVSSIEKFCDDVKKLHPDGVDILVNNAGVQHLAPIDEYPTEQWDRMIAVSLSAPFHLIKSFLPGMKKKGWGRIVNISSLMSIISAPGKTPYSAAKTGLIGLTKGVALETASSGVTCNAICPGFTDAPLVEPQIKMKAEIHNTTYEEGKKIFFSVNPTKKAVEISELADLAVFMCSDSGASMTGSSVLMDGGYTTQ